MFAEKSFAPLPTLILELFGFLPTRSDETKFSGFLRRAIAAMHVIGAWVSVVVQFLRLTPILMQPISNQNAGTIVTLFSVVSGFSEYGRSAAMITIYYFKNNAFPRLSAGITGLFTYKSQRKRFYQKWAKLARFLSLLILMLQLIGQLFNWVPFLWFNENQIDTGSGDGRNITVRVKPAQSLVPSSVVWGCYYFQTSSFALSQQMLVQAVTAGASLRTFLVEHNLGMAKLQADIKIGIHDRKSVEKELERVQKRYSDILVMNGVISGAFGNILCIALRMDQVTVLGMVAGAVANPPNGIVHWICACFLVLLFGCYCTVLFWPIVQVSEEVQEFNIFT
ncbi:hypothetical protein BV898_17469 [Hypsibius exemplaris]|uniref:Uncharacterized protein n=1 Tax=Hypsibius exemplaris TaxID=2072580 RepID=A0A9X6NHR0_HYPEX|nr:hypothetical protein BV898_17469 [Hypsibius exemplaris]